MKVTQYQRQVKTNAVSGHKLTLPEDTFGKSIAKGLGDVGTSLGGIAIKMQEEANTTASNDQAKSAMEAGDQILFGNNGLMSLQGANAVGLTTKFKDAIGKIREKYQGNLHNSAQRRMFDEQLNRYENAVNRSLLEREFKEGQAQKLLSQKAMAQSYANRSVLASSDPGIFNASSVGYLESLSTTADMLGYTGEVKRQYIHTNMSNLMLTAVQHQLASNPDDPSRAIAIYEDAIKNKRVTGKDAVTLATMMSPIIKAKQANNDSLVLAQEYVRSRDINYQLGEQFRQSGHMTPELQKKLEGVTDPTRIAEIFAQEADTLLVEANGDAEVASQLFLSNDIEYVGVGSADNSDGVFDVSSKAKVMARKAETAPNVGVKLDIEQALKIVSKKFPDMPADEVHERAKKLVEYTQKELEVREAKRATAIERVVKIANASNAPLSVNQFDTSGMTATDRANLAFFLENSSKGKYDIGIQARLWDNTALLGQMGDGEFSSLMLRIDPLQAKQLQVLRQIIRDPNTPRNPPPEAEARRVFKSYALRVAPHLYEDKDYETRRELLFSEFYSQVRKLTKDGGVQPDDVKMKAILMGGNFDFLGRPDLSIFQNEKALDQSPRLKSLLTKLAGIAGWGTSDDSLVILGQTIMSDDSVNPTIAPLNKTNVEQLLTPEEQRELLRQERLNGGRSLNGNQLAKWLISRRGADRTNVYGTKSDNKDRLARLKQYEDDFVDGTYEEPSDTKTVEPLVKGNIDLNNRPIVRNEDGSFSTVRSMSINVNGKEVLIPTVSDDGRILTPDEAVEQFERTGKHLGKFATSEEATAYAKRLHDEQAKLYASKAKRQQQ